MCARFQSDPRESHLTVIRGFLGPWKVLLICCIRNQITIS